MTRSQALIVLALAIGAVAASPRLHAELVEPPARPAYEAQGKRDPFVPLVRDGRLIAPKGGGEFSSLTLVGILWDPGGQSIALINDMAVKAGDVLGDYQVQEIRQDGVVLMRDGKPVVLQLSFETAPQAVVSSDKKRRSKR
jgi:hypothetical protein